MNECLEKDLTSAGPDVKFVTIFLLSKCLLNRSDVPSGWSLEAADFVNKVYLIAFNNAYR